jgi:hypothetical protein
MSWVIAVVNIGSGPVNQVYRLVRLDVGSSKVLSVAGKNMRAKCFGVDRRNSVFQALVRSARALAPYSCASPVRSLPALHHTTTFRCSRRRNHLP